MKRIFLFFLPLIVLLALSGCNIDNGDTEGAASENSTSVTASDEAAKEADTAPEEDFEYIVSGGSVHIKKYLGGETVVVVPDTIKGCAVESIDAHFLDGSGVEEITYPRGMTEFRGLSRCEDLKTLHLPASIEKMQDSLRFCENLTEIDIEEGGAYKTAEGVLYTSDMKTLVSYPCGRTGSFTVPDGVESIGKNAFFNSKLSEVVLPYGVESIGAYAFDNSKLSEIVLPDSLKTVEDYAFANAQALKAAAVPASVSSIGVGAFRGSGLEKITLSEGLKEIMSGAFCETFIEELYIPASVTECGYSIADGNVRISASYPSEGLKRLLKYENVDFRDETRLEDAFRKAENIVKGLEDSYYSGVIFTDITGDNFPEIMRICGIDEISIYFFSEKGEWQALKVTYNNEGYRSGNLKFHLLHDKESDTYSYYSDIYDYKVVYWNGEKYIRCQFKLNFTKDGMEYTELFNDEVKDLSSEEIIKTMDISGILNSIAAEYDIDIEDEYKKFTMIADGLAEEPNGKIFEKTLALNGKTIEALPYFESAYPGEMKLTVAGKDILRGEEVGGVYFRHGALVFDNAVIDAQGKEYVIEAENMSLLRIELIGENRVVSEKPCSLLNAGDTVVRFKGDGSLEAPRIKAYRVYLLDGVRLRENKALVSGVQGLDVGYLNLMGNSSLEYEQIAVVEDVDLKDNAYIKLKSLICDGIWLYDNSTAEIVNDIPEVSGLAGCSVRGVRMVRIQDNARLCADNSTQNYDTLLFYGSTPCLTVSGSGQLEINGSDLGAGISMLGLSRGTVNVYDGGSIVINGSKSCIEAPRIEISGGSMELNACDGGQVIKTADKDENFESGYFVSGEVLSESPEGWEMVTENGSGVMYCDGKAVTSYSVSVKQREYDEANGFSD